MRNFRAEVIAYNTEIKNALQTVYDSLNNGQRQKLLKNATVKALLDRYGVQCETK